MSNGGYGVAASQDIPPWQKSCPKCRGMSLRQVGMKKEYSEYGTQKLSIKTFICSTCHLVVEYEEN